MTKILLLVVPIIWVVLFWRTFKLAKANDPLWKPFLNATIVFGIILGLTIAQLISQY